jgi:hypothetical protein
MRAERVAIVMAALAAGWVAPACAQDEADEGRWVVQLATTPDHRFRVWAFVSRDARAAADKVEVEHRGSGVVVQLIDGIGGMGMHRPANTLLDVVDVNFDGHPDLVVAAGDGGAGPNNTDNFYLYDPRTRRYVFHEVLSSLTQVVINPDHSITSSSRGSCCSHLSETYRFVGGQLTLVASWEESLTADGAWIETTKGRLRGGKMRYQVKRQRPPAESSGR